MSEMIHLTDSAIADFRSYLTSEEKSEFTIAKYLRDVGNFAAFLGGEGLTKEKTLNFKKYLKYLGRTDCRVKNLRIQELPFNPEEKNLKKRRFGREWSVW